MKEEHGKIFLECDGERFEFIQNNSTEKIKLSNRKTDKYEPLTVKGTFEIISVNECLKKDMLWLKILYLSAAIAKIMRYKMLGISK
ncbi:hypothetical protein KWL13_007300 [Clostridioides difficile]|uniref:hypothetical protein n=1 Tax=Clostridioides difficile TaxID=1496 RepID=UPI000BB1AD40|nr:hypothetical protein [Clostridioides difficile]EGT5271434.1 hypothetical protein [Clostridioides difficile]EGT5470849.1 hypothetical protein [Clostridioides difficile]MBH7874030.1 hypothetical protein [Clostridioides difficile]MBH8089370.1 hypothetical protein [Clostridioides difficile]MBY1609987.1 hypothetical protein [Clostridioides difficile]